MRRGGDRVEEEGPGESLSHDKGQPLHRLGEKPDAATCLASFLSGAPADKRDSRIQPEAQKHAIGEENCGVKLTAALIDPASKAGGGEASNRHNVPLSFHA